MAMYSRTQGQVPRQTLCTACKGRGHSAERCWTVVGYPPWHSRFNSSAAHKPRTEQQNTGSRWSKTNAPKLAATAQQSSSGILFSQEQLQQLAQLMPQLQQSSIKNSESDEELDVHFSGMISEKLSSSSLEWIVDSGASDHMTPCLNMFDNATPVSQSHTINLPTGDTVRITHIGNVLVNPSITLKNVLCVPTFKHNLLSVQKLSQENNCEVKFEPTQCIISDKNTKQVIGIAKAYNGLYLLNSNPFVSLSNAAVHLNLESLWHHRLGHTPLPKLAKIPYLQPILKPTNTTTCLTCPMAKMTKLPFRLSESIAPKKFDLVHVDIWGPYKVPYQSKYKFFLTLVDDHSRHCWVYLLKQKSDSLATLHIFLNYVDNQFNTTIKVIRSDNALEFTSNACNQFFSKHGILHQTTCVYRPQQNARVERKHRNILELARALRFQANLPIQFWGDCVLTAVHILNRIPSSVIEFKTPYEILFDELPIYDYFRVFGCLAFALNPHSTQDKFEHRGVPCLFLGYPPLIKGYKLFNLQTQQCFISRDVKFNETVFPYHLHSTTTFMSPIPPSSTFTDDFIYTSDPSTPNESTPSSPTSGNTSDASPIPPPSPNEILPPVRRSTRPHQPPPG